MPSDTLTNPENVSPSAERRDGVRADASPRPWRIDGQTIRDADGGVVVSALNPANGAAKRLIVDAVNQYDWANEEIHNLLVEKDEFFNEAEAIRKERDRELLKDARAALSAPARNCDRFATAQDAVRAFQLQRGHRVLADVALWDDVGEADALVDWLFAPAEGGAE